MFRKTPTDPTTCGDPHCGHPAKDHGPSGGPTSDIRCFTEKCRCKHAHFIEKTIPDTTPRSPFARPDRRYVSTSEREVNRPNPAMSMGHR